MKQNACIYQKRGEFIIHSLSQTISGLLIATEPFIVLPIDTPHFKLKESIYIALNSSKIGIAHPTDWGKKQKEFLKNIKEKSLKTLHIDTKYCEITLQDNIITIYPTENLGPDNGFSPLPEKEIITDYNNLESSILMALQISS